MSELYRKPDKLLVWEMTDTGRVCHGEVLGLYYRIGQYTAKGKTKGGGWYTAASPGTKFKSLAEAQQACEDHAWEQVRKVLAPAEAHEANRYALELGRLHIEQASIIRTNESETP